MVAVMTGGLNDQVAAPTLAQHMSALNTGVMAPFGTPQVVCHRPAFGFMASLSVLQP